MSSGARATSITMEDTVSEMPLSGTVIVRPMHVVRHRDGDHARGDAKLQERCPDRCPGLRQSWSIEVNSSRLDAVADPLVFSGDS